MSVGTIITGIFMIIEWWLKRQANNEQALADFYKFVHSTNVNVLDGVQGGKAWRDQASELAKELDRQEKEKQPKGS